MLVIVSIICMQFGIIYEQVPVLPCQSIIYRQAAALEQAADKPGTVQYHRKVVTSLQKQIDDRRSKQEEFESTYQQKKEEYMELRAQLDEVLTAQYLWSLA